MKINPNDIKIGLKLLSYDMEDHKWYKAEIIGIDEGIITMKDIDDKSDWQGMIWETNSVDIFDITLYKTL